MMDTKVIARKVANRGILRADPERAYLLFLCELAGAIKDIATRPEDYQQAIERYAPTMPPVNAAGIRECFPALLDWSQRFGSYDGPTFKTANRAGRDFGEGNILDPIFWCYYHHDRDCIEFLNFVAHLAVEWARSNPNRIEGLFLNDELLHCKDKIAPLS